MTTPPDAPEPAREPAPFPTADGIPAPAPPTSPQATPPRFCAVCGAALPEGMRFCPSCGAQVGSVAPGSIAIARGTVAIAGTTYDLASWWRRFGAVLIDGLVGSLIFGAVAGLAVLPIIAAFGPLFEPDAREADWDAAASVIRIGLTWLLPLTLLSTAMGLAFEVYGWSFGKAALGMRAVRGDGHRPGLIHGAARAIGERVSGGVLLLGYLWAAWDPKRQAWHDKFADTYVVRVPVGGIVRPAGSAPLSTSTAAKIWAGIWVLSLLYNVVSVTSFTSQVPRTGAELRSFFEQLEADFESDFEDFEFEPPPTPRGPRIEALPSLPALPGADRPA